MSHRHDGPLIIGGGLAGLSAALAAGPRPVLLVTPAPLMQAASSAWAQGGLAAALAPGDTAALHAADTLAAGAGLSERSAVESLTVEGVATAQWLADLGAPFDRTADGGFRLGREAAHSVPRVARVGGDGAGRAILAALIAAVRASPHVTVWEDARLVGLMQDGSGRVGGAVLARGDRRMEVRAPAVVLATGGIGGLYAVTTNPSALRGEGLGLAALAGAEILDPEFVQFHPTAVDIGADPAPLATEALRGEGARLVDASGAFLMGQAADADLAPRDQVARVVHQAIRSGRGAFLDARAAVGEAFPDAFPAVFAACLKAGVDPREQPIPVAPAAHYHMGGVAADPDGRTSLSGLFAVGECAAAGVHGANRLASNSLLEAAAFGRRTGRTAAESSTGRARMRVSVMGGETPDPVLTTLRAAMTAHAGVVREAEGLERLLLMIDRALAAHPGAPALVAARLIAQGALERRESRGGHFRSDFPSAGPVARHTRMSLPTAALLAAE